MYRFTFLVVTILAFSAFGYAQSKIGVINAQEIIQKTKKGVRIQKKLENLQKAKTRELQKMLDDIKKLEKEILNPRLNAETRERKSRELQGNRTEMKRKYEDAQRDFQRESQKELLALEKELVPLITSYGKTNGFTVIYDMSRAGNIVYFDSAIDITADLVKIVDARLP